MFPRSAIQRERTDPPSQEHGQCPKCLFENQRNTADVFFSRFVRDFTKCFFLFSTLLSRECNLRSMHLPSSNLIRLELIWWPITGKSFSDQPQNFFWTSSNLLNFLHSSSSWKWIVFSISWMWEPFSSSSSNSLSSSLTSRHSHLFL